MTSSTVAIVAGSLLVILVFLDVLSTTLVVAKGAGPLTRRLIGLLWRGLLRLHRRDSNSPLLTFAGPMLLVSTVIVWVLALWCGWSLVFLGSDAVVDSRTNAPAGTTDIVYYTGFTVFTLGTGDFVAATPWWRVVSSVASFTGLFLVTLGITYLISVVSAVVARRSIAIQVSALGGSGEDIVVRGWSGQRFSPAFTQHLVSLTGHLATTAEQHLAYPVLHYFHTHYRSTSAPLALAHLEEAMLLLTSGVAPSARPDAATMRPVSHVIDRYVTTASTTSALPHHVEAPPAPDLTPLVAAGIPVVAERCFRHATDQCGDRRRSLHRLVNGDGWSWPPGNHSGS